LTAYFADVEAINSVVDNADITLDVHVVKAKQGIAIDFPLIALGVGGRETRRGN
jgi:hypothetical protein